MMSSIKGKKLFKPGSEWKTKLNNWLWHPWQEDLKSIICDKCRIFIYFIFLNSAAWESCQSISDGFKSRLQLGHSRNFILYCFFFFFFSHSVAEWLVYFNACSIIEVRKTQKVHSVHLNLVGTSWVSANSRYPQTSKWYSCIMTKTSTIDGCELSFMIVNMQVVISMDNGDDKWGVSDHFLLHNLQGKNW